MTARNGRWSLLKTTKARVLTLALVAQLAGLFAISRQERVPLARPLNQFPTELGSWDMYSQSSVEQAVLDVLRADDVLSRTYYDSGTKRGADLFIAYFKSQRSGQAPHSPKNCLPGSGWMPSESDVLEIPVSGRPGGSISVNRYVVSKGDDRSVVLYWYQAHNRVIASEYRAKLYLVADAIRYNRTDTALVRIVVPVLGNRVDEATDAARAFVQALFPSLRDYLPS